jgi:hypothetical protein
LAGLSREQHKYSQAEAYFQQALTLAAKAKGENSPLYARVLHPLAYCRLMEGKDKEAETLRRKELLILDNYPKEDEGWMRRDGLRSLADMLIDQRRYSETMPFLKRRLATIQKLKKNKLKFELSQCLMQIADVEKEQGHYSEAERQYLLALQAAKADEGENSVDYASALSKLADNYQRRGNKVKSAENFAKAGKLLQSVLNKKDKSPDIEEHEYRDIYSTLAENCQLQKNFKDAEMYWEKSLPYWQDWEPHDKGVGYRQTLVNLDKCTQSLGQQEKSAAWKKKLQEYKQDRS